MDDNGLWLVVIHHESVITEPSFRVLYAGFHTREGLCVVGWWESDVQWNVGGKVMYSETWTLLNTIIGKRKSEAKYSNEFIVDIDRVTLDNEEIANHFNNFFVNMGQSYLTV